MKECTKCKKQLADEAMFCPHCGTKQSEKPVSTKAVSADDFFDDIPRTTGYGIDDVKAKQKEEPKKEPKKEPKVEPIEKVQEKVSEPQEIPESPEISESPEIPERQDIVLDSSIVEYEFVDESVFIDDPFAAKIDYRAEEEKARQQSKVREATKLLEEICYDEKMTEALYSLTSPHVIGFRAIITGNDGSNKEYNLKSIGEILHLIGKIDSPEPIRVPFGKMPEDWDEKKLYIITDLSSAIQHLFNLEDVSDEANQLQQEYVRYMERLLKAPKSAYIILNAYTTQVQGFITLDPRIRYIFQNRVDYPDLTNDEIYRIFYDALPEFHKLQLPASFEFDFKGYLERNKRFFPFSNKELALYLAQTASKQAEFKLPKEKYNAASLEDAFSTIIGMNNVKDQVHELQLFLKARKELEEAGAKLPAFHLHMLFLGNPGVGKTTIARIVAKVLFDLGYIREEKLIEVTSKDLVGNGNQTGIKTNKAILSALGGVLFVDEAYSLARSCGQAGEECIATLIKAMEDYKKDLVVMYAGYTLEMNDFVKANSGMASRIAYTFTFQDYTPDELYDIFALKVRLANMFIHPDAVKPIKKIIEWGSNRKNFGNGRYIDKLFQRTLTKHATLNLPKKEILILRRESVPSVEEVMQTFGKFLGQ